MKKLLIIFAIVLLSSCVNMGIYDGKVLTDETGQEYKLKYNYAGYYFLEIQDDSGNFIPDNRYERLKKKENKND